MGERSIPRGADVTKSLWGAPKPGTPVNWLAEWTDVKRITAEALSGKHGVVTTFWGDGLHKLYRVALAVASNGESEKPDGQFEAQVYGRASNMFFRYLESVLASDVPYAVFTVWNGREKDDPADRAKDAPSHVFPELPGKAAKEIMGYFDVVLHAGIEGAGDTARYYWQTKPGGVVWGAGLKGPVEITRAVPLRVPQDWAQLETRLRPAQEAK
jgi:hypothetical protein